MESSTPPVGNKSLLEMHVSADPMEYACPYIQHINAGSPLAYKFTPPAPCDPHRHRGFHPNQQEQQQQEDPGHGVAALPAGPPARPLWVWERGGAGLRFLLPRAAVAWVVLRHEAELLLPALRQAGGGLRDPRPVAQPRRRLLPAELQPRQRVRPLQGERPAEQPAVQLADAGVPDQRRPPLLGARVGEARHLRREPLQRARLLPGGAPPPRPAPRPRRPPLRRGLPRRWLLYAVRHQGRHQGGHGVRAPRRLQPRRVRQQPALPALLLRRRRRLPLRRMPRPARRQTLREQDRVPGLLIHLPNLPVIHNGYSFGLS